MMFVGAHPCLGQRNYFPPGAFDENQFKVQWYSKFLKAMDEPSLWDGSQIQKVQTYRFLWLRSFHHPVSVGVVINPDGTGLLITKISDGHGGYEPGRLITNQTQKLGHDQTKWVLDRVEKLNFWAIPTDPPNSKVVGMDGARWIVEGAKDGTYHVVDRWSPHKGEVHSFGTFMLFDLAKLELPHDEVY